MKRLTYAVIMLFYFSCLASGAELRKLGQNDLEFGVGTTTSPGGKVVTKINASHVPVALGDNTLSVNDAVTAWVDVRAFGAKGDGATDDTAAIQAANDNLVASGSRHLYFPKGVYRTSSEITIGGTGLSGFKMSGDGAGATTIRSLNAFADNTALVRFKRAKQFILEGITFDANDNVDHAAWFDTPTPMTIRTGIGIINNCQFINGKVEGVRVGNVAGGPTPSPDVSDLTFNNCGFSGSPIGIGFHANNALINKINDGIWNGTFATGVWLEQGEVTIKGGQMVGATTQDILLGGGARLYVDGLYSEQSARLLTSGSGTHTMRVLLNHITWGGTPTDGHAVVWSTNAPLSITNSQIGSGDIYVLSGENSIFINNDITDEMAAGRSGYNDNEAQFDIYARASIWDKNGIRNAKGYAGRMETSENIWTGVNSTKASLFYGEVSDNTSTVGVPTGAKSGQIITYMIKQVNGGGWDIAWNATFKMDTWSNTGNTVNKVKTITFVYWKEVGWYQVGAASGWY